jgi:hypothetical protein
LLRCPTSSPSQQTLRTVTEEGVRSGWLISKSEFLNGIPKFTMARDPETAERLLKAPEFQRVRDKILEEATRLMKVDGDSIATPESLAARAQDYLEGIANGRYRPGQAVPGTSRVPEHMFAELASDQDPEVRAMFTVQRDKMTAKNWAPLIGTQGASSPYAPLAGWYASPEDVNAFAAAFFPNKGVPQDAGNKLLSYASGMALRMAGVSLGVMTLGNPGYYTRNIFGNVAIMLAQGVNPFSADSIKAYRDTIRGALGKDGDFNADIDLLFSLGVLGDGLRIEYLRDLLSKWSEDPMGVMDAIEAGCHLWPRQGG